MPAAAAPGAASLGVRQPQDLNRIVTPQLSPTLASIRWLGLIAGPVLALAAYLLLGLTEAADSGVLSESARRVAAIAVLMATWWLAEAIPLAATALIPVAVMPLLGIASLPRIAAPYASDIIFLFAGGLLLGMAMERWGLHRRIALITISFVGTRPTMLVGGFMLATAILSLWVSNTATAVMMTPIALSVITLVFSRLGTGAEMLAEGNALHAIDPAAPGRNFAVCLLLGVAYAASIGGVGTLIGTPPNALLAGFARREGFEITFVRWLWVGIPFVAVFLPVAWLLMTRVLVPIRITEIPGGSDFIRVERGRLGPMSPGEWATFTIFCLAAVLWVREPILAILGEMFSLKGTPLALVADRLTDAGVSVMAGLALFIVPVSLRRSEFVLDWHHASRLPFEILVLFGGGLALAAAISETGLDAFIGSLFGALSGFHPLLIVLIVSSVVIFLTELTSNTAVAATFLPILHSAAPEIGVHPLLLLIPATIAASWGFMLPMGTPPNAIAFATGQVTIPLMARTGFWLNAAGIIVISLMTYFFAGWLLGVDLT
jgi:sodium-dependent dicarboxylate transporter 2/3/5